VSASCLDESWSSSKVTKYRKVFGAIPGVPVGTWWESRFVNFWLLCSIPSQASYAAIGWTAAKQPFMRPLLQAFPVTRRKALGLLHFLAVMRMTWTKDMRCEHHRYFALNHKTD
jgi:hypothetical protein